MRVISREFHRQTHPTHPQRQRTIHNEACPTMEPVTLSTPEPPRTLPSLVETPQMATATDPERCQRTQSRLLEQYYKLVRILNGLNRILDQLWRFRLNMTAANYNDSKAVWELSKTIAQRMIVGHARIVQAVRKREERSIKRQVSGSEDNTTSYRPRQTDRRKNKGPSFASKSAPISKYSTDVGVT